jgi:ribosomal-protein-alanine N-acetyltransferase
VILESARLLFRPVELADLDSVCALEADPEVRRYIGGQPRPREIAEARFLRGLAKAHKPLSLRAAIYKPESCFIGICGLYPHFRPGGTIPGEAMLSFKLARQWWNQGLATEAGSVFLAYGFEQLHLRRIRAVVESGNLASTRVLEKLGFTPTHREPGPRALEHFERVPTTPIPLSTSHFTRH